MYISHLVKTRDLYPGLLQFAIKSCFLFLSSLPLFVVLFLYLLSLSTLLTHYRLSGGAIMPFSL
jgi:hypothetical protein